MCEKRLEGKVAVVTGGGSGIGKETVHFLLSHGAKVASLDVRDSPARAADDLIDIKCDVSSDIQVRKAINAVVSQWGRIDFLLNIAGVIDHFAAVHSTTDEDWKRSFAVNVNGPMYLMRACVPHFLKQDFRGRIINVCSTASIRGAACGTAYTASKHALLGLSRSTSWMYAKEGIKCNAIVLGPTVGTNITSVEGDLDPFGFERTQHYVAILPEALSVPDIMPTLLYLLTAPGINGAELAVDHAFTTA